ncbi:putative helix loop helix domain containing protein [Lyophyllum shimeji]|uniref:Helix loop helix domain containing protein n=1 Tax=Lyophyllum shimeji TaxID=47721 RepID=A0A9P3PQN9_LYOSH|nr:putative helix loop helix domain containing protein [Lyophyllum shimeji]
MDSYAGSSNPSRRAKQLRIDTSASSPKKPAPAAAAHSHPNPPRNILPVPTPHTAGPQNDSGSAATTQPATPAKRGRKPGPLSRSARETQRKLNHSIIEKARRTKINDALATLRQLVPADYGYPKPKPEKDDDDQEYDAEGEGSKKKDSKPKKPSKREEKEKEFKLEILVRTVSFMQDLLERVKVLEEAAGSSECAKCLHKPASSSKRRHDADDDDESQSTAKRHRRDRDIDIEPTSRSFPQEQHQRRLPPISSWLPNPNSQIDPLLLSPSPPQVQRTSPSMISQLPSPPASTHFVPVQSTHVPPVLNLGPVATSALLSPRRTPEDESAASLLLQISANSAGAGFDMSKMRTSCVTPVPGDLRRTGPAAPLAKAQTPGSMLGLTRRV